MTDLRDMRALLNAQVDQLDAAAKNRLRRFPRHKLDSLARELGIPNPEWSNKPDLAERIFAHFEREAA